MWKVVAVILHRQITASITYHDVLHGFRAGCGTVTTTLEAKLIQHLAALREEVLYMIFLDLHKAYDALDRSRCLETMKGYGVVPLNLSADLEVLEETNTARKGRGGVLRGRV